MRWNKTFTISNGASLSNALDMGASTLATIYMPAAWTAAVITFSVSADGTTWVDLYDGGGNEVSEVVGVSRAIVLDPSVFAGVRWVKLRSGTASVPVAQAADRSITVRCVPVLLF